MLKYYVKNIRRETNCTVFDYFSVHIPHPSTSENSLKPRPHCPDFLTGASRFGQQGQSRPHRSNAGKHRIESGWTVLNRRLPESGPGVVFFKSGTHRGAKQNRLFPGHHRSSYGMIRFSTVRPAGETVVKPACLRWLPVWSQCI